MPYLDLTRDRIISIFCYAAQGGQGKKVVTVTVAVFITLNFANVNTALQWALLEISITLWNGRHLFIQNCLVYLFVPEIATDGDSLLDVNGSSRCLWSEAYPSEAPFRCSTLGQAPGLTLKHQTRLAKDKHSILLRESVNYGCKKLYSTGPWYRITMILDILTLPNDAKFVSNLFYVKHVLKYHVKRVKLCSVLFGIVQ